jgi:hypothetical protein
MNDYSEKNTTQGQLRLDAAAWCRAYQNDSTIAQPPLALHLYILRERGSLISVLKDVSASVLNEILSGKPSLIQYLPDASDDLQLISVSRLGSAVSFIKNPCYAARLKSVQQQGTNLQYFTEHTPELEKAAVDQTGYAIAYIKHPSDELIEAAVRKHPGAIKYIEHPSQDVQKLALFRTSTPMLTVLADLDILMKYTHKFSSDVIDLVRPGLSVALQFAASDDNAGRLQAIDSFLALRLVDALELPHEYAGPT